MEGVGGAAWVFTRTGSVWKQQGSQLTANDEVGSGSFGRSVALSWDGNTALIGGPTDNVGQDNVGNVIDPGAAWVFTRSGSSWTQQGSTLTGAGALGPEFGSTVALSADGQTALIGGDNAGGYADSGAVWIYGLSGSAWKDRGTLDVIDKTGRTSGIGSSLAFSANGDMALVGGVFEGIHNVWEFTRSGAHWTQGTKLPGVSGSEFGESLAVTPDGDTAFIGTSVGVGPGSVRVFRWTPSATVNRPLVSGLVPAKGATGAQVTILGKNLTGTGVVQFGQTAAKFITVSSTRITATIPLSAMKGKVTVVTPDGTATSTKSFNVLG